MSSSSNTRPSWKEWVDRNSQPKQRYIYPTRFPPTRWQKAGPMSRDQWVKFYKWLETNGERNPQNKQARPKPIPKENRQLIPGVFFCVENQIKEEREKRHQLQTKLESLSQPKLRTEKFVKPAPRPFAYRPQLSYHGPPRPEVGRPIKKPPVPCCFQHEDVEAAFWANIRFPVSKKALRAHPTQKIIELAQPRTYPPKQHCKIPVKKEDQPRKRKKMSSKQWRQHLARLEFLSRPNPRVLAELPCCRCPKCLKYESICELCGCRKNCPLHNYSTDC